MIRGSTAAAVYVNSENPIFTFDSLFPTFFRLLMNDTRDISCDWLNSLARLGSLISLLWYFNRLVNEVFFFLLFFLCSEQEVFPEADIRDFCS